MNFLAVHRLRVILTGLVAAILISFWAVKGYLIHSVLPEMLHKQLTTALNREVSFHGVNTNLFTYFSVQGLTIAQSADPSKGNLVAVKELVIQYSLRYIVLHPRRWSNGIRKLVVIEPHLEVAMEDLKAAGTKRPKPGQEKPAAMPPIPKSWLKIEKGSIILTRRGAPVLEIKRIEGELNLRDLPHVDGRLKLVISPEAVIAMNGSCHLALKNFEGAVSIEHLDLGQLSDLARMADASLPVRVGGLLKAELEVQGGFMSMQELIDNTTGRGSLELTEGSIAYRGSPLVTDAESVGSLDGREIALDHLDAKVLSGDLSAAGHLGNLGQGKLLLSGRLNKVPVQALKALSPGLPDDLDGLFSFEFSATGTGRHPMFSGRLTAPLFGVPGYRAENVVAEAVYSLADVRLTNLSTRLWSGSFTGGGVVGGLDGGGDPRMKFSLKGTGVDIAQSPIGPRGYAGFADLDADLEGPAHALTGSLHIHTTRMTAKHLPVGDLDARARFEGGAISVDARTAGNTAAVTGTIVLHPEPRCEGCRLDVQERLPVILALAGVTPPKDFEGRASGSIRISGPLKDPVITAEAVASGVRIGKTVIGDTIRVPKFVFTKMTLSVPDDAPMELAWGAGDTTVSAYGDIPVAAFSREGKVPVRLHVEAHGRLDILKRLDLVERADGSVQAVMDVAGTAAYPVWSGKITGSGGTIVLKNKVFDRNIESWSVDAAMVDSLAQNIHVEIGVDKQKQVADGRFGMNGWELGEVVLSTETVSAKKGKEVRGLPLALDGIADLRVKLNATLRKEADDSQITVTGPDEQAGADLNLSNGNISYVGGSVGGGGEKKTVTESGGPPAPSWFARRVNFLGTVTFGRNVSYVPESIWTKIGKSGFKFLTDKAARKNILKQFSTTGGVTAGLQGAAKDLAVEFDVRIREGSRMRLSKVREEYGAEGSLELEPGSKINLILVTPNPPFLVKVPFTIVDDPGKKQEISFPGGEFGLRANVALTGEDILIDRTFNTPDGAAKVDELHVRLVLVPRSDAELLEQKRDEPRQFLNFKMSFAAEPDTVTGEVDVLGGAPGAQQTKPVTIHPTQGDLYAALTGADSLGTGSDVASAAASAGVQSGLNIVLLPFKWALGLIGIDIAVKKSDTAGRHQAAPAATPGDPGAGGNQPSLLATALQNQEMTVGKQLLPNLYLNNHTILLDANSIFARSTATLAATKSNTVGDTTELEFRNARFKAKIGRRWTDLPDDPILGKGEWFGKMEVNQSFSGVSQREPLNW